MYRLLLLLILHIFAAEACRPMCHWTEKDGYKQFFVETAEKVTTIDKKIQDNCNKYGISHIRNVFGDKEFKMAMQCPGFQADSISVRHRNHVLYISGTSCRGSVSDVRVMPEYFDLHHATWAYEKNELTITIPYVTGSKVGRRSRICEVISEKMLDVPTALVPGLKVNKDANSTVVS